MVRIRDMTKTAWRAGDRVDIRFKNSDGREIKPEITEISSVAPEELRLMTWNTDSVGRYLQTSYRIRARDIIEIKPVEVWYDYDNGEDY